MNKKISLAIFSIAILAFAIVGVVATTSLQDASAYYYSSNTQYNSQGKHNFNNQQSDSLFGCNNCNP
jgi:hypothetical protein